MSFLIVREGWATRPTAQGTKTGGVGEATLEEHETLAEAMKCVEFLVKEHPTDEITLCSILESYCGAVE